MVTDKTDARELTLNLDRYLRGNLRAMSVVRVPTAAEEQRRALSRHREQLRRERQRLAGGIQHAGVMAAIPEIQTDGEAPVGSRLRLEWRAAGFTG